MSFKIFDNSDVRLVRSEHYNYNFRKSDGYFERWGKTKEDDPMAAPFPEILDIEISDKCSGVGGIPCAFCYKSNTPNGTNMSFETFKTIIDKMKPLPDRLGVTQIAFGADASCTSNPDLFKMMEYSRECDIVPNITVADISEEVADKFAKNCVSVAVSRYQNKSYCYDSVERLTKRGMTQVNIHQMICNETLEQTYETISDIKNDSRLLKMNAIVFLSLKQKGRGTGFTPLSYEEFSKLIRHCLELGINFGMDSCSAGKMLKMIQSDPSLEKFLTVIEPCESTLMSSYINVDGEFFPCSFTECAEEWQTGIDVVNCDDFVKDVWNHPRTEKFRNNLLNCKRFCPLYNI